MNVKRGNVVLVDFPFARGGGTKLRPALMVQNDRDNLRLSNTVVAQITGNVLRSREATQVLIERVSPAGEQSGLQFDSVVNCVNLATLDKTRVIRKQGELPIVMMQEVNEALKAALELL